MTILIGYAPAPVGEAELDAGRGDDVMILNSSRRGATVDTALVDEGADATLVARAEAVGVTARVDHADHGSDGAAAFDALATSKGGQLVVIGLRRRSAVSELVLGSIAPRILLESCVPGARCQTQLRLRRVLPPRAVPAPGFTPGPDSGCCSDASTQRRVRSRPHRPARSCGVLLVVTSNPVGVGRVGHGELVGESRPGQRGHCRSVGIDQVVVEPVPRGRRDGAGKTEFGLDDLVGAAGGGEGRHRDADLLGGAGQMALGGEEGHLALNSAVEVNHRIHVVLVSDRDASTVKGVGLSMVRTKEPRPWKVLTKPSARNRVTASRATVRETSYSSISAVSDGNLAPVGSAPSSICIFSRART